MSFLDNLFGRKSSSVAPTTPPPPVATVTQEDADSSNSVQIADSANIVRQGSNGLKIQLGLTVSLVDVDPTMTIAQAVKVAASNNGVTLMSDISYMTGSTPLSPNTKVGEFLATYGETATITVPDATKKKGTNG